MAQRHPAKFNDKFLPIFVDILNRYECKNVLDPMAGVGKIAELTNYGYYGCIYANEIEAEWAQEIMNHENTIVTIGDAAALPYDSGTFCAICTSPTYGNRMADCHNAKDGSRRMTYTHTLGRKLNEANTGKMQWGKAYQEKSIAIMKECNRVLTENGIIIWNVSNHIRGGEEIDVSAWYLEEFERLGYQIVEHHKIATERMKFGANADLRVAHENIYVLRRQMNTEIKDA